MLVDRRNLILGGMAAIAGPAQAASRPTLRDFLGVNTHLSYTDGAYADPAATIAKLNWLGIRHVRDNAPNPASQGQSSYTAVAEAGFGFSLICWLPPSEQLALIKQKIASRDALVELEGPNELNNNPTFRYRDKLGAAAGPGYIDDLKAASAADPFFNGIPIAGVVSFPVIATACDLANVHSYPKPGARPIGQLRADVDAQRMVEPGRPVVITEAGYNTTEVSEADQARLTEQLIEDALALGVVRLYLYELLDDRADNHWGLFRLDGSPKPAAETVRKLLRG